MKVAVFLSFDTPYRIIRLKDTLRFFEENWETNVDPYFFLPPSVASPEVLKVLAVVLKITSPSLLPSERLSDFPLIYVDVERSDLEDWVRPLLKKNPPTLKVFQYLFSPDPRFFVGDVCVYPFNTSKIELNRYFYQLFRMGKLTTIKEFTSRDILYTNLKNVYIFTGTSFMPHTAMVHQEWWSSKERVFLQIYFPNFTSHLMNALTILTNSKIEKIYIEANPFWDSKEKSRFQGVIKFFEKSFPEKIVVPEIEDFYGLMMTSPFPKRLYCISERDFSPVFSANSFLPTAYFTPQQISEDNLLSFFFKYHSKDDFLTYIGKESRKKLFDKVGEVLKEKFIERK